MFTLKCDGEKVCQVPLKLLALFVNRSVPENVLLSVRRVEEADEPLPLDESVPPENVRLVPIFTVFKCSVPSPYKSPEGDVVPVPPCGVANCANATKGVANKRATNSGRSFFIISRGQRLNLLYLLQKRGLWRWCPTTLYSLLFFDKRHR